VTLVTSPLSTGMVAMATVLAEQAKAAGVTINLDNVPSATFFGKNYLSWTFSQDFYSYDPYLMQVSTSMLSASPFNETHTSSSTLTNLYQQANATLNASVRKQIKHEMQVFDFNQGGYIIPAYIDALDAYSTKITGYSSSVTGLPLSNFDFEKWSFI
jgi:peptide/nickel transport system substrate-binding protein